MGVYEGYKLFKETSGEIRVDYMLVQGLIKVESFRNWFIKVNRINSLEEQVKTLIHEFLHLSPEYFRYTGNTSNSDKFLSTIEEELDKKMEIIYDNQPCLVRHLKGKIQKVLEYNLNNSKKKSSSPTT